MNDQNKFSGDMDRNEVEMDLNKFMDKDVKSHFRYGSDVIYILTDDTVIIKKANGESVIMKPDNTVEKIDK